MTNLEKLRAELRSLRRGDLLEIAERATLLLPRAELDGLLGDFMKLDVVVERESPQVPLIEDVQRFYRESLEGRYFDELEARVKHRLEHSRGTDAFLAEMDRLLLRFPPWRFVQRLPAVVCGQAFVLAVWQTSNKP